MVTSYIVVVRPELLEGYAVNSTFVRDTCFVGTNKGCVTMRGGLCNLPECVQPLKRGTDGRVQRFLPNPLRKGSLLARSNPETDSVKETEGERGKESSTRIDRQTEAALPCVTSFSADAFATLISLMSSMTSSRYLQVIVNLADPLVNPGEASGIAHTVYVPA